MLLQALSRRGIAVLCLRLPEMTARLGLVRDAMSTTGTLAFALDPASLEVSMLGVAAPVPVAQGDGLPQPPDRDARSAWWLRSSAHVPRGIDSSGADSRNWPSLGCLQWTQQRLQAKVQSVLVRSARLVGACSLRSCIAFSSTTRWHYLVSHLPHFSHWRRAISRPTWSVPWCLFLGDAPSPYGRCGCPDRRGNHACVRPPPRHLLTWRPA